MSTHYSLNCCAEVNGRKVNVELAFLHKPTDVAYMADQIELVFRKDCFTEANMYTFAIDYIVFLEEGKKWKTLASCHQLQENMQLYVFQTDIAKEHLGEIPEPSKLIYVPELPEGRVMSVHNPGFSVVDIDKVEALFKELDINDNDAITLDEMQHAFVVAGLDFKSESVTLLFDKSDANDDGLLTFDEFRIFADLFPNTTEVMYWRLCHGFEGQSERVQQTAAQLKSIRQQEHDIRKQLIDIAEATATLESRLRQERSAARERDPRRAFLENEEQDLMNKEFSLQFQRDMVIQAENKFSETAVRFDHSSMNIGSPRRARLLPN
eukprot:Tbor_TRINITY_DN1928_c0_g1::TRINITY_DN1928_c0_g1_i1::g.3543::m.3543